MAALSTTPAPPLIHPRSVGPEGEPAICPSPLKLLKFIAASHAPQVAESHPPSPSVERRSFKKHRGSNADLRGSVKTIILAVQVAHEEAIVRKRL
eukprot:8490392-Pyramimonas_sp.AAC.1